MCVRYVSCVIRMIVRNFAQWNRLGSYLETYHFFLVSQLVKRVYKKILDNWR